MALRRGRVPRRGADHGAGRQQRSLKEAFGEAQPAVIVNSSLGVILLIAVTLSARTPWPSVSSLAGAPWWGWLGGALGAVYAVATVLLARELGAAPLVGGFFLIARF